LLRPVSCGCAQLGISMSTLAKLRRELIVEKRSSSLNSLESSTASLIIHARRPALRRDRSWFCMSRSSKSTASSASLRMDVIPMAPWDRRATKLLGRVLFLFAILCWCLCNVCCCSRDAASAAKRSNSARRARAATAICATLAVAESRSMRFSWNSTSDCGRIKKGRLNTA